MICPWWLCFTFDNWFRTLFHDPENLLSPYVKPGNTVIDIGPGMGYFTIPLARLVGPTGHVIAIDVQTKMLSALVRRAEKCRVSERITPYLAETNSLGSHPKADFILAFYMVHEVPDKERFFSEIYNLLKPGGLFLLVEPIIHVSKKSFLRTLQTTKGIGFVVKDTPKIRMSYSVLLTTNENSF